MFLRYRIITAPSPWIAPQYPPYSQNHPFQGTILKQCLSGIFRTSRCKTTRRRSIRCYKLLIEEYRQQQHPCQDPCHHIPYGFKYPHSRSTIRCRRFIIFSSTSALVLILGSCQTKAIIMRSFPFEASALSSIDLLLR